jgi:hypothetical protein
MRRGDLTILEVGRMVRCAPVRVDYIHEDKYASLGLAVLQRQPLAFLPREDRAQVCDADLAKYLPDALRLSEVPGKTWGGGH